MIRVDRPDVVFTHREAKEAGGRRGGPAAHADRAAGPCRHAQRRGIRAPRGPRCARGRCVPGAEREERRGGGAHHRRGGRARRGDDLHEHGRPRHRHPAGSGHQRHASRSPAGSAASTSSARTVTRAAASICSCAAAPAARAIRASRGSSCQPRGRPPRAVTASSRCSPAGSRGRPTQRADRRPGRRRRSGARAADHRGAEPRDPPHAGALLHRARGPSRGADGTSAGGAAKATKCRTSGKRIAERRTRRSSHAAGDSAVREAERVVTLACIDRAWCDHLAFAADLREGIHLVALGGLDPLTRYTTDLTRSFRQIDDAHRRRRARVARRHPPRGRSSSSFPEPSSKARRRRGPIW